MNSSTPLRGIILQPRRVGFLPPSRREESEGSVIVGLLWCLALLSVLVVGILHSATLDLRVTKNLGDQIQARYLAIAGLEKAKALLYHEAWERRRSRVNHSGKLYNAPEEFRDIPMGRGSFRVIRQAARGESPGLIHGVVDEESKLNLNHATEEELGKLEKVTVEEVAAILDYKDGDHNVRQGGAESEQYAALQPPYLPHNGPFRSVREVLMVRGLSGDLFLGEDANLNGLLDPEEDDGSNSDPVDNSDGFLDAGWSAWITPDSQVRNVNAAGQQRVNIQQADESALAEVPGLTEDLARAIVQYRNNNPFENLTDLMNVTAPAQGNPSGPNGPQQPGSRPPNERRQLGGTPPTVRQRTTATTATTATGRPSNPQPPPGNNRGGQRLISEDLFMDIADDITVESDADLPGRVNINTASIDVLACLPGLDRDIAQNIINERSSSGFFPNIAHLLRVPDINRELLQRLAPRITVRSQTFRVVSEGRIHSTGARQRIEATIRIGTFYVDTLSYREDDL